MKLNDLKLQFRNYYLDERGLTAKSYRAIISHMEQLLKFSQTQNIRNINDSVVREFLSTTKEARAWSPKTIRTYLQSIRTFFKWCQIRGFVKDNPTRGIGNPKLPKRLPRCLTKEQAQTIVANANSYHWISEFAKTRNTTILYMFLYTGIRLNELLKLQFGNVDLIDNEILVREGKGRKDRIIPIHPTLNRLLRIYFMQRKLKKKQSKWFFTGINSDKRLYEKNIHEICSKVSISSGVKFTPHMLRHTFARLACDENINLFKLKEILGHSAISTTQIYLSVSKKGVKESVNNLEIL